MWVDSTPRYNQRQRQIIKTLVEELPKRGHAVVRRRFWQDQTLTEIAFDLELDWSVVSDTLKEALASLREGCLKYPSFSDKLETPLPA